MSTQLISNSGSMSPKHETKLQTVNETLDRYAIVWALTQSFIENNDEIILLLDNNLNIIKASKAAVKWLSPNNGVRESRDIEGSHISALDQSKRRRAIYGRVADGLTHATVPARHFKILVQKIPGGIAITRTHSNN